MFSLLDLIAPIGTGVLAVALCIWGAVKAKKTEAKVVCFITAFFFAASIPLFYVVRASGLKPDYVTRYGIKVKQGVKNRCEKEDLDKWSSWVVDFWSKHTSLSSQGSLKCSPEQIVNSLRGVLVVCRDEEKLTLFGRHVRGYQFGNVAVVGYNGKKTYTESLFKHEVSHFVLHQCGVSLDEELHHKMFAESKLGH